MQSLFIIYDKHSLEKKCIDRKCHVNFNVFVCNVLFNVIVFLSKINEFILNIQKEKDTN